MNSLVISRYIKIIKRLLYISIIILCAILALIFFPIKSFANNELYFLIAILIILLGSIGFYIFKIDQLFTLLQKHNQGLQENLKKNEELQISRVQKINELSAFYNAIDQTIPYARIKQDGTIISIGQHFSKLLHIDLENEKGNLVDILGLNELQKNRLFSLISQNKGGIFNEEFELNTNSNKSTWLEISILTIFKESDISERLVLCSDISKRHEAQNELELLQHSRYKEKEELQKSNASQIVEAQEEERKRIAKEIHDSIGQMLTALKFNIESINLKNKEKTAQKIEGLKQLSNDLIRGTRIATFNLTPPELKDYGVRIALQKLTKELSKLTGKNILFENKSNFDQRLDSLVETNLYRVTQEAVNNAIKYADSDFIMVTLNHSTSLLSIIIEDNGKGFDSNHIPSKPVNNAEGGMGLFFMKERMTYINGRLFITSIPQQGTRITLNYSL